MRSKRRHHDHAYGQDGRGTDGSEVAAERDRSRRREGRGRRRRRRAQRGDARLIVLDALRDSPKHGYEIIKSLEDRSAGQYVPSPGTVYPTLQFLADQDLVSAQEDGERRVYQITEGGLAALDAQAEQVTAFWERFAGEEAASETHHEVRFLQDELEHLNRIVWNELRPAIAQERQETVRQVRAAVETCQQQVRQIIAVGRQGQA